MNREEFSDMFTTLLNSHSNRAGFGEAASGRDIVLDEYEKSVFLTIAQDMVLKSYFDGTLNAQNQGFDDTIRRQVDFSSLITVASLSAASDQSAVFDDRGIYIAAPSNEIYIVRDCKGVGTCKFRYFQNIEKIFGFIRDNAIEDAEATTAMTSTEITNFLDGELGDNDHSVVVKFKVYNITTRSWEYYINKVKVNYAQYNSYSSVPSYGSISSKPTNAANVYIGFMYMTNEQGPIFVASISDNTINWVDATGATIG